MLEELNTNTKVVGLKQSRRALKDGIALKVFLAHDAGGTIRREMADLCQQRDVPCEFVSSMKELGRYCGISVGASVAAIVQDKTL